MDADGLPLIGSGIDFTKVEAIHQKRTLAFLNHFVTHTARFLNRFSCVCEEKLANISLRIQRLETTMNLLETKLSSIPGLENVQVTKTASAPVTTSHTQSDSASSQAVVSNADSQQQNSTDHTQAEIETEKSEEPNATPQSTVSQDPAYAPFFKMLKLGVPLMAVKQKLALQGLDPNMLDNPDAPSTANTSTPAPQKKDDDDDFSDEEPEETSSDDSNADFSD